MLNKFKPLFILIFGIALISVSCYKINLRCPVYYTVINSTDETITVVYQLDNYNPYLNIFPPGSDTIIVIAPHQQQSLFVKLYEELNEATIEPSGTLSFLDSLKVYIHDTIPAKRNFLQLIYWDYTLLPDKQAAYNLTIDNNTFMP